MDYIRELHDLIDEAFYVKQDILDYVIEIIKSFADWHMCTANDLDRIIDECIKWKKECKR